ncbi:hypothetical protein BDN71DRAFT_217919 [Pleurotus eryngii]|uniref:Transmembrane protein n=1 Tax=Pleurotus eryngii TaxID=5323 RepID=A0A9P5ZKW3_PLEER|nr:hypothetical protein BDN71DRAFT_217919 [Pleurotus eryngii]
MQEPRPGNHNNNVVIDVALEVDPIDVPSVSHFFNVPWISISVPLFIWCAFTLLSAKKRIISLWSHVRVCIHPHAPTPSTSDYELYYPLCIDVSELLSLSKLQLATLVSGELIKCTTYINPRISTMYILIIISSRQGWEQCL